MSSDASRRLRVRAGDRVVLLGAVEPIRELLTPLPEGASFAEPGPANARVVVVVADQLAGLDGLIRRGVATAQEHGTVWVAWRDRTPGLHLASVRRIGTLAGLVPGDAVRLGADHAALGLRPDRDDRTFRDPGLRV